jgi:hypothetical protein
MLDYSKYNRKYIKHKMLLSHNTLIPQQCKKEYLFLLIKLKKNYNQYFQEISKNGKIDISKYLNIKKYEKKYNFIINKFPSFTTMTYNQSFLISLEIYYNIDLMNSNKKKLLKILNKFNNEFQSLEDFFKLNINIESSTLKRRESFNF